MNLLSKLHGVLVFDRRTRVLSERLAALLPAGTRVLDVGCGNGLIDRLIAERRPDVTITGCDLIVRPETHIPVTQFDGKQIPFGDGSFDVVMFVDVLHHTEDPAILLAEARRVAREAFAALRLTPETWLNKLDLYAPPATWLFDRSLHFIARLDKV